MPVLMGGCVPRYGVSSARDEFLGTSEVRMHGDVLGNPDHGSEWIELNAVVRRRQGEPPAYALQVRYRDSDEWLRIPPGESLIVLADSQRIRLDGFGSRANRRTHFGLGVEEVASYAASADVLRSIARAERVRLRIIGSRDYVEREFTPENRARFRQFVDTQVDGKKVALPAADTAHASWLKRWWRWLRRTNPRSPPQRE
ncbi:MAG TPA: hypothetical protein VFL93_05845 [Longimicrobiaceae bacterium]|nr:hypothetical protein [Longimicrobiaceae bacterium]